MGLWLDGRSNPKWVKTELAAMKPYSVQRSAFFWTTQIIRFVKEQQDAKALEVFDKMLEERLKPDRYTFIYVFKACTRLGELAKGRQAHAQLIRSGCESDMLVLDFLVGMYAKCGSIEDACQVFLSMQTQSVVAWTAMIACFVNFAQDRKALMLFRQMQLEGVEPNNMTYFSVINACANLSALEEGILIHAQIIQRECQSSVFVLNSVINMYLRCGDIEAAWKVFNTMPSRSVVSWNAMITGFVKCRQGERALELFKQMQEEVKADSVTFLAALCACASLGALEEGRRVHAQIIRSRFEYDININSCPVDMYAKCGGIEAAYKIFDTSCKQCLCSWSAVIGGDVNCGQKFKALELFQQMQEGGTELDKVTFLGALNACTNAVALQEGKCIHAHVVRKSFEADTYVGNCLVDMYAKCGSIEDACRVYNNLAARDVVSLNALLGGYAMHGLGKEALHLLDQVLHEDLNINSGTFVGILSACAHAGKLDEGQYYFETVVPAYGLTRTVEHYSCIVDLLGRAGHLHQADAIIRNMSYRPKISIWMALLGACRIHGDAQMAESVTLEILKLNPESGSALILLSNIYAATDDQ